MNFLHSVHALVLLTLIASTHAAPAAERTLDRPTLRHLSSLQPGQALTLDAFPVGPASAASIRLERVQIYSDDAHVYVMTAGGRKEAPRSDRIFLRGYSDDGRARVAMSLNADTSFAEGNGSGPEGSFVLQASVERSGVNRLVAKPFESTLPAGFNFDFRCGNENENLDVHAPDDIAKRLGAVNAASAVSTAAATTHALRLATVAVDTDSLFMSRLFTNNTANATNWIASMFNTMNMMYERDLVVRLYQGTTILCASGCTDPYTSFSPGATTTELSFFANYWKINHASVSRSFAILLSGQISSTPSSCGASGIAWINQYCQKGFPQGADTVGSYSVNQVCTSINLDPSGSFNARIVGHEIGHNFGAWHTHCTNTSTGAAPVATNTIDTCYNLESGLGCYGGMTTSCPAGGSGTIMSYCNFTSVSGCASGTQNQLKFHPTQINQVLLPAITSNSPSCLNSTDDIFYNGFE